MVPWSDVGEAPEARQITARSERSELRGWFTNHRKPDWGDGNAAKGRPIRRRLRRPFQGLAQEPTFVLPEFRCASLGALFLRPFGPVDKHDAATTEDIDWRRGWDSNPRGLAPCRFSRPEPSTTRPPLRIVTRENCAIHPLAGKARQLNFQFSIFDFRLRRPSSAQPRIR
jgi:hypothetical protein